MLASLAFPYTLDTRETITEGMGMECLVCDYMPENNPGHNLVAIPSPYKTRGGSTIANRWLFFPYEYSINKFCYANYHRYSVLCVDCGS